MVYKPDEGDLCLCSVEEALEVIGDLVARRFAHRVTRLPDLEARFARWFFLFDGYIIHIRA